MGELTTVHLRECCNAYLAHLDKLDHDWAEERTKWADGTHPLIAWRSELMGQGVGLTSEQEVEIMNDCLVANAKIRSSILRGEYSREANGRAVGACCPWTPDDAYNRGVFGRSYRKMMAYFDAGGRSEDLNYGPVEVVPQQEIAPDPDDAPLLAMSQIRAGLRKNSNRTAYLDPILNGTFDRESEGVKGPDERGKIYDRYKWEHDLMTGQRTILDILEQRDMLLGEAHWFEESEAWYEEVFSKANRNGSGPPIPPSEWHDKVWEPRQAQP